jgi:BolA protein
MLSRGIFRHSSQFAARLQASLQTQFAPSHLVVINDSHKHSKGTDSHYRVVVVSDKFEGLGLVARHREVQDCAKYLFEEGLQALAISAKTPKEWNGKIPGTPGCMGKNKH